MRCALRQTPATAAGFTLPELLLVGSLALAVGAFALTAFTWSLERVRAEQAARHLAAMVRAVRTDAIRRNTTVALLFFRDDRWSHQRVVDGNGNGVRLAEVRSGTDVLVGTPSRLADDFAGVQYGVREPVPDIDAGGLVHPGTDPIRTGASDVISCSPDGGCSSGTIYLSGNDGSAWAVRTLGVTARVRVLKFDRALQEWTER